MKTGSLIVVGTGIRSVGQLTVESIAAIENAEKVFYLVSDPIGESLLLRLNASAESLQTCYSEGKARLQTYNEIVNRIMYSVREGKRTCAAFYGHPGVFVLPSHEAIRRARSEGYYARMLPGISAEDCLFADLGVDPANSGSQSYEATDFVMHQRNLDTSSAVIIWQIGVVGHWSFQQRGYSNQGLPLLLEKLSKYYLPNHRAFVYQAAVFPGCEPLVNPITLSELLEASINPASTLYIPPAHAPTPDLNMGIKLGLLSKP
jgi:uncharacterized protein YabN with tetrapyrrole methylase and pyrophosphatase domain